MLSPAYTLATDIATYFAIELHVRSCLLLYTVFKRSLFAVVIIVLEATIISLSDRSYGLLCEISAC